ncbi:MAG: formate/nitrite transporter family protein [Clostridia bacterium]|nr:formate/nitrite transporter family protein [Clostridia bacterium]
MNSPAEVANNYVGIGTGKVNTPIGKMFVLAILAGMYIGFAGLAATTFGSTIETASVAKFANAAIFPGGLAMVLIAGSELFTGNNLIVIPLLRKKVTVAGMLKNWVVVWCGNLVGGILVSLIAFGAGQPGLFGNAVAVAHMSTALSKCSLTFGTALVRGIGCNFLVCIAVWMSFAAKDVAGKIVGLYFPIMFFVLVGFEHSVANMYYISMGLFCKMNETYVAAAQDAGLDLTNLNVGNYALNLSAVTIGNIIGGSLMVGLAYYFAYLQGKKED